MRQQVALYKNQHAPSAALQSRVHEDTMDVDDDMSGDEAALEIPLDELIDELDALGVEDVA